MVLKVCLGQHPERMPNAGLTNSVGEEHSSQQCSFFWKVPETLDKAYSCNSWKGDGPSSPVLRSVDAILIWVFLNQELVIFFSGKQHVGNILGFEVMWSLLQLLNSVAEKQPGQYYNGWAWLCSNKTLFKKKAVCQSLKNSSFPSTVQEAKWPGTR